MTSRVAVVGFAMGGVAFLALAGLTSGEAEIWDSPLYGWQWVLFPVVVGVGAYLGLAGPGHLAAALVAPQAVWSVLDGTVLHDDARGASLWPVGLFFLLILWFVCSGVGEVARVAGARRRRLREERA